MARTSSTTLAISLDEYFIHSKPKARETAPFKPIAYTSMRAWMFLNYSLLVLLFALPVLVIWAIF